MLFQFFHHRLASIAAMSLPETSLDYPPTSVPRSHHSFTSLSRPASIRPRTGASVRHAFNKAVTRFSNHVDSQDGKAMLFKECSLYTTFLLAGFVDASTGALLPSIRQRWNLSFALVSMLFVGTMFGCFIAASCISSLMDRYGFGMVISGAAALGLVFPVVFLAMPPFPVLIVASLAVGASNSTLDAVVNVWISQRPRASTRLGFLHFMYGVGALSSPLAALPFVHEGRRGIPFQYFYFVTISLALLVLVLVTAAFRLQRDEHVEGPAQQPSADTSIELQQRPASRMADNKDSYMGSAANHTPAEASSTAHDPIDLMPIASAAPAAAPQATGFGKLKAVVKQQKVQLLACFTMIYVGTEVTVGGWT